MSYKHLCPLCGSNQIYFMDTYLCRFCNREAIEELKVAKLWKEIYKLEKENEENEL